MPGNPISEGTAAGTDTLEAVLPATQPLTGPFVPTSDQSWLTVTGAANGVVHFAFTANTVQARTAHIDLLGEPITINQAGVPTVTTPTSTAITTTSAVLGGDITNNGGADLYRQRHRHFLEHAKRRSRPRRRRRDQSRRHGQPRRLHG